MITERDEIEDFLKNVTVNFKTFDYKKYLDLKTMETPNILGTTPPEPVELINVK